MVKDPWLEGWLEKVTTDCGCWSCLTKEVPGIKFEKDVGAGLLMDIAVTAGVALKQCWDELSSKTVTVGWDDVLNIDATG